MLIENIVKVILPAILAFATGLIIAPVLISKLNQYKVWKKKAGKVAFDGTEAVEFNKIHKEKEKRTPRMGGIVVWGSVIITVAIIVLLSIFFPSKVTEKLNFLSRSQTWIPFFVLVLGSLVGLFNDYLDVASHGNGLSLKRRLLFVVLLSSFVGWWFYAKLGVDGISIPFDGVLYLGPFVIGFFVILSLALYASGVIDGLDGLSGGVFSTIFAVYTGIALYQDQIDLAAFTAAMLGATLAFLWYNIPPAQFFMSETGTMGITLTLATIAFMTDSLGGGIGIAVLPIVGALLVMTVASNIIQIFSKKFFHRKVFKVAPIHHHFEAKGWPPEKVVMRYWVLSIIFGFVGFIIALVG